MSKSMIEAFVKAQYGALTANDNRERLRHVVVGCKNGRLYSHSGTDYGEFDAPDTIFSPDSDTQLTRITGVKMAGINKKMLEFFDKYGANPVEVDEPTDEPTDSNDEPTDSNDDTCDNKSDDVNEDAVDTEAVEKACKKAIKKGDFKKAQKLIDKLGGHKKLQKKLDKAQ